MLLKPNILALFIIFLYFFFDNIQAENSSINVQSFNITHDDVCDTQVNANSSSTSLPIDDHGQLKLKNCTQGKIIALNKVTATSKELTLKINESKYFGNIKLKLHQCVKNLNPYAEDNYILLTITETKIDEDPLVIFQGWIISSSISLSTFEHPIYEIFAKDCF